MFIDKGMRILNQCREFAKSLLARTGSAEGLLTTALPPDTDQSTNGGNGRKTDNLPPVDFFIIYGSSLSLSLHQPRWRLVASARFCYNDN